MPHIIKKHIAPGIFWIEIKEAGLFLCCGCPADTIKHLKKGGVVNPKKKGNWYFETGPNAILLSDTMIQNGKLANLTEFVILHMLYLQGLNIKGHPNYQKYKPILIGYDSQITMQMEYVSVGNHGFEKVDEIVQAGMSREDAEKIFATKVYYSGGTIKRMSDLMDTLTLEEQVIEIKKNVSLKRVGLNKFQVYYKGETETIDLNLDVHEQYITPYKLPFNQIKPSRFSITHSGEGNGWDIHRPCMSSILHFEGKIYLIDAGPNILNNLARLGIGLSEIEGIFLSHMHDDHFAGITDLLNVEKRLKLYSTPLIRATAKKKLNALFNSEIDLLNVAFHCIDLEFSKWNNIEGLEVKPTYSPHTVETSIFKFRVKHNEDVRSYLHLADTINFKEFKIIIDQYSDILSSADFDYIKNNYLAKVNLKKLDVGGGAIHGHIEDYKDDKSDKLVMAHTDKELVVEDTRFINAEFGETDHLIEDDSFDFLNVKAVEYLKKYFNTLPDMAIQLLANQKTALYKPGEKIESEDTNENIFLILSGLVKFINEIGMEQWVDAGNFLGYSKKYFLRDYKHQYVSLSYVVCLQYKESYIDEIFSKYNLLEEFKRKINLANTIRASFLVQYALSGATFYELAGASKILEIPDHDFTDDQLDCNIYILQEGSVTVIFEDKYYVDIHRNQHFGGLKLLRKYRRKQRYLMSNKIKVVCLPIEKLMQVPTLLWKLIELEEKRFQLSIFETE